VLDVKRIGWTWAAVILLMFPALNTIATLLSVATGGPQPAVETARRLLTNPLSFIPYLLFLFVFRPCLKNRVGVDMPSTVSNRGEAPWHLASSLA
jgi:hypothetical protein